MREIRLHDRVRLVKYNDDPTLTILAVMGLPVPTLGTAGVVQEIENEGTTCLVCVLLDGYDTSICFEPQELELVEAA